MCCFRCFVCLIRFNSEYLVRCLVCGVRCLNLVCGLNARRCVCRYLSMQSVFSVSLWVDECMLGESSLQCFRWSVCVPCFVCVCFMRDGEVGWGMFDGYFLRHVFWYFLCLYVATGVWASSYTMISTDYPGINSLTAVDMDADGDLDVLMSSDGDDLRWFRNDSKCRLFSVSVDAGVLSFPPMRCLCDV